MPGVVARGRAGLERQAQLAAPEFLENSVAPMPTIAVLPA